MLKKPYENVENVFGRFTELYGESSDMQKAR